MGGELEFSTPIMNDVVVVCDRKGKERGKMPNRFYFTQRCILTAGWCLISATGRKSAQGYKGGGQVPGVPDILPDVFVWK